jgi:hypothetical protein
MDRVSGYAAFARFDAIDDKIVSPVVIGYTFLRKREMVREGKIPESALSYPRVERDQIEGLNRQFKAEVGEVVLYDSLSDTFRRIGNLEDDYFPIGELSGFKEQLEPLLEAVVPEEDRRDWIQRWKATGSAEGCVIHEIVSLSPGERQDFSIEGNRPMWAGFHIEKIDPVAAESGKTVLYPKESRGSNSGWPTVRTVIRPINGTLQFTIANDTAVTTKLAVFTDPSRDVPRH